MKLSFRGDTAASADFFPFLCLPMDMHCKADPFSAMHREYWSPAPSASLPLSHPSIPPSPNILPHLIHLQVNPFSAGLSSPSQNKAQSGVQEAGWVHGWPQRHSEGPRQPRAQWEHSSVPAVGWGPGPTAGEQWAVCDCVCAACSVCEKGNTARSRPLLKGTFPTAHHTTRVYSDPCQLPGWTLLPSLPHRVRASHHLP